MPQISQITSFRKEEPLVENESVVHRYTVRLTKVTESNILLTPDVYFLIPSTDS